MKKNKNQTTIFIISVAGVYKGRACFYELKSPSIKQGVDHIRNTCGFIHSDLRGTLIKEFK